MFQTKGAAIRSLKLKDHFDVDGFPQEMIIQNNVNVYPGILYFNGEEPEQGVYHYTKSGDHSYTFSTIYETENGDMLQVTKNWTFEPEEYLFALTVDLKILEGDIPQLNESGGLYSIASAYELGPVYDTADKKAI